MKRVFFTVMFETDNIVLPWYFNVEETQSEDCSCKKCRASYCEFVGTIPDEKEHHFRSFIYAHQEGGCYEPLPGILDLSIYDIE